MAKSVGSRRGNLLNWSVSMGFPGTSKRIHWCWPREIFRRVGKDIEQKRGVSISAPDNRSVRPNEYPQRVAIEVRNGIVIVFSDAHYWPGPPSLMHRALVTLCKEYKPKAIIANGDVIDAPSISRHAPIGWEHRPKLSDEIEVR